MKFTVPPKWDPHLGRGLNYAPPGNYLCQVDEFHVLRDGEYPIVKFLFQVLGPPALRGYVATTYWGVRMTGDVPAQSLRRVFQALSALGLGGRSYDLDKEEDEEAIRKAVIGRKANVKVEFGKGSFRVVTKVSPAIQDDPEPLGAKR